MHFLLERHKVKTDSPRVSTPKDGTFAENHRGVYAGRSASALRTVCVGMSLRDSSIGRRFIPVPERRGILAVRPVKGLTSFLPKVASHGRVKPSRGFTLIELMVSVGLFSVVMTIAIGSLLTLVDANRKAQALKVVTNNLSFAMDSMTRTIRTGADYYCGDASTWSAGDLQDCTAGGTDLTVIDDMGVRKRYSYNSSALAIVRYVGNSATPERMTAPGVQIDNARFYVTGTARTGDTDQPRVTILIQASAGSAQDIRTTFNLQTTVTQRMIDI